MSLFLRKLMGPGEESRSQSTKFVVKVAKNVQRSAYSDPAGDALAGPPLTAIRDIILHDLLLRAFERITPGG